MALYGVGEPKANQRQRICQALKIELYRQWQTYNNGVHLGQDNFDAIDFERLTMTFLAAWKPAVPDVVQFGAVITALHGDLHDQWQTSEEIQVDEDTFGSIDFVPMAVAAFVAAGEPNVSARGATEWNAIPG